MGALSDNYKKKSYTGSLSDKYFTNRGVDPKEIDKINTSISRRNILKGKVDSANAQAQVYQQQAGGVVNAVGNFADRVYKKIPTGLTYGNALKKVFVKAPVAAVQGAYKLVTAGTQKVVDARFQETIDRANLKAIQDNTNSILLWRDIAKRDPSKADVAKNNIGQIMQQNTSLAEKTGGEIKNMTNKQMAGLALEVGIDLGTLGLGSLVTKSVIKGAKPAGSVAKFLMNEIADNKATILATGSTLGAGYGAGAAMQENKNTQEILKSAGIGAAMGAGLVVAFPLALKLVGGTIDGIKLVKKLFNKEKLTDEEIDVAKTLSNEIKETSPVESKAIDDALEESEKVTTKTEPEDPLLQEARKYKSAEEFVKAKTNAYHSGSADIQAVNTGKSRFDKTFYLSDKAEYAKGFGGKNASLNGMAVDPKAKLADMRKPSPELVAQIEREISGNPTGKTFRIQKPDGTFVEVPEIKGASSNAVHSNKDIIQGIKDGKAYFAELPEVKTALRKLGYDGQITAEVPYAKNIGIWNKDVVKTKSQLTDLYNKAQGGTPEVKAGSVGKETSESPILREINKDLDEASQVDVNLPTTTIKKELDIAAVGIKQDPQKAYNKAVFNPDGNKVEKASLQLLFIKNAIKKNDNKALAEVGMAAARTGREAGQTASMFQALYDKDPVSRLLIQLARTKMANVESKYPRAIRKTLEEGSDIVARTSKAVKKKAQVQFKDAQSIIDGFICK